MIPRMSNAETILFEAFIRNSNNYLEFGSGGSTCAASQAVKESIVTIDSSQEWLEKVKVTCLELGYPLVPKLIHADIGPTGEWGIPTDQATRERWPSYHQSVWNDISVERFDLYMVDGRFRVACFMQTLLHCRNDALLMFHDYASRPHYHVVEEVARKIAASEDLAVFLPGERPHRRIVEILEEHRFDYR